MAQPTKEQWAEIEDDLKRLYSHVWLLCDGFYVSYSLKRTGNNKLEIVTYVNGYIKGCWYGLGEGVSEEAQRFWRPITRAKFTAKYIKRLEKIFGKRKCKQDGVYEKRTYYVPLWNVPGPLIRHLKKNNKDIQVITAVEHNKAVAEMKKEAKK